MTSGTEVDVIRHRATLDHVPFIAITGSCGKTTTKTLAAGILDGSLTGTTSPGSLNCGDDVVANVARVDRTDAFCLQELGAWGPGTLDAGLLLVRPTIGVVLNVRRDHQSAFHTLSATAAEKAKVVAALPPSGTAILNADDERVFAMRHSTVAATLSFGRSRAADLRATAVSARWPRRLSFRVSWRGSEHDVETRLLGEHCLGSALAAIGIALTMGVPMRTALTRLAAIEPPARRMSAEVLPDGVTFIRDDFKAPSDSMTEVLRFMSVARADRKIAVIGRISDHPGRSRPVYERFARQAVEVVDELVFVGERADALWARDGGFRHSGDAAPRTRVRVFREVRAASRYLNARLRPGDLVLLKGSGPADHLERILLDRTDPVRCWRSNCGRTVACDECELLHVPGAVTSLGVRGSAMADPLE